MYTFLCGRGFSFVLGVPLGATLLGLMLMLCFIFQRTATLCSVVAQSFGSRFLLYSECNFVWRLVFLCCCSALFMSRFPLNHQKQMLNAVGAERGSLAGLVLRINCSLFCCQSEGQFL